MAESKRRKLEEDDDFGEDDEGGGDDGGWGDMQENDEPAGLDSTLVVAAAKDEDKDDDTRLRFRSHSFRVLDQLLITKMQREMIDRLAEDLHITPSATAAMLRCCKWNEKKFLAEYRQNPEALSVKANVKASLKSVVAQAADPKVTFSCGICMDKSTVQNSYCLNCTHRFCRDCWVAFLEHSIDNGSCLTRSCPMPKCPETVGEEVYEMFLSASWFAKYTGMQIRSFVDDNEEFVWCPSPGCGRALGFSERKKSVSCDCNYRFCFRCKEAAHHPASCARAESWRLRDKGADSLNAKFLLNNTKPCPKCKVRTEKNGGCMHVVCTQCKFQWCWHCGGGDHHVWECNKAPYSGGGNASDQNDSNKYLFYYERYFNHKESLRVAEDLRVKTQVKMAQMVKEGVHARGVQFLLDAVEVVIESRRVLAWTYVHAYNLTEEKEQRLFEFQQSELEKYCEKLNQMTEGSTEQLEKGKMHVLDYSRALANYLDRVEFGSSS
jgi:ariadne-1